jgi:hypothetical protein
MSFSAMHLNKHYFFCHIMLTIHLQMGRGGINSIRKNMGGCRCCLKTEPVLIRDLDNQNLDRFKKNLTWSVAEAGGAGRGPALQGNFSQPLLSFLFFSRETYFLLISPP